MRRIALVIAVVLAGCATHQQSATQFRIEWTDDPQQVCDPKQVFRILGCAKREGSVCVIYTPRPRSEQDVRRFVTLGHEMLHCVEGAWHDEWGRGKL